MNMRFSGAAGWPILSRLILFFLLALLLVGCGTTPVFKPAVPPNQNTSLVYVIRKHFPPYNREARLFVNDIEVATIPDNDVVAVNVPVGLNYFQIQVTDEKPLWFKVPIDRSGRGYVVLTGKLNYVDLGAGVPYRRVERYVYALPVNRSVAESTASSIGKQLE
jgi:hypothetical protein